MPGGYTGPGDGAGLSIGLEVTAEFEDVVDEHGQAFSLIAWRPVEDSATSGVRMTDGPGMARPAGSGTGCSPVRW